MKRAGCLVALALLGAASDARARPAGPGARRLAEAAPASAEAQRVVVTEGDAKTARLVGELEQELKASSYVVVRVPKVALEPEAMLRTLREAHAARGILLAEDGKSVVVLAASPDGKRLRVYGEYSVDRDNRLARRRQWISLVERLRVPTEDEDEAKEGGSWVDAIASQPPPVAAPAGEAAGRAEPGSGDSSDRRPDRLGVTAALGYVTGRTGITSHLLLMGHHRLSPRISLVAHGLWPMVPGERASDDGLRSRVWTFAGAVGLLGDLGRPSWWANPYLGMTVGVQFLLAYVDWTRDSITDTYRVASLLVDVHAGVRLSLRRGTWLVLQASGGRVTSLATRPGVMTDSLADAWAVRSAVGLLMAL
jgi:hypothetical protein